MLPIVDRQRDRDPQAPGGPVRDMGETCRAAPETSRRRTGWPGPPRHPRMPGRCPPLRKQIRAVQGSELLEMCQVHPRVVRRDLIIGGPTVVHHAPQLDGVGIGILSNNASFRRASRPVDSASAFADSWVGSAVPLGHRVLHAWDYPGHTATPFPGPQRVDEDRVEVIDLGADEVLVLPLHRPEHAHRGLDPGLPLPRNVTG